ncbi:MAG: phosphoribosylformylglycinamidine synthase subunit PurL [Planctomycetota bacterium]
MNQYRIEVGLQPDRKDHRGEILRDELAFLGRTVNGDIRSVRVYHIRGALKKADAERFAAIVLADAVVDIQSVDSSIDSRYGDDLAAVEIFKKSGVMEPVRDSIIKTATDFGVAVSDVWTAKRWLFPKGSTNDLLSFAATQLLANEAIEDFAIGAPPHPELSTLTYSFKKKDYAILDMTDAELVKLSADATLSLTLAEMKTVRDHFKSLGRNPVDIELETIAQTWSEHCVHKTLKGLIRFKGPDGREEIIDNLLKQTIARVTTELDKPWCISVFKDNSGIIEFNEKYGVCFKVETHNHPSAIEPYGGAGTGIGGVIRDILGTGLGAKPIANTDVFCFGDPAMALEDVPRGALHPRRVMKGVVSGVRDYGNRMGIPTVNGGVYFDPRYVGNPLVYCGTVGIIPKDKCFGSASAGERLIVIGGRTGRDGIHGATFSSIELHEESETVSSGAVQIGNPIMEKKVLDVLLTARDEGLFTACTDCGAGGLSSACGEMGETTGVEIHLDRAPLKYAGLSYTEIWISEAQERMVVAVKPDDVKRVLDICASEDVEAIEIGHFTGDGKLHLFYKGNRVAEMDMQFLHNGVPRLERVAEWHPSPKNHIAPPCPADYGSAVKTLLAMPNVASKEWIYRQYDHEVQGATVIKPFAGPTQAGPSDAAVITPVLGDVKGVAISNGMNPKQGDIDPYRMAACAVDEAIRNAVCVGANPDRIAILDNFCWGNTSKPDRLGALVLAAKGATDAGLAYGTPFISGKDSLNNEYQVGDQTICIPHTLLISAMGIVNDVRRCATSDLKAAGNALVIIGITRNEMGASHYYEAFGGQGGDAPRVDLDAGPLAARIVADLISSGLVRSAHDLSEGGLAVAAAEMVFGGGIGASVDLDALPCDNAALDAPARLFSETPSRYLLEIASETFKSVGFQARIDVTTHAYNAERAKKNLTAATVQWAKIGDTVSEPNLVIRQSNKTIINESATALRSAWTSAMQ